MDPTTSNEPSADGQRLSVHDARLDATVDSLLSRLSFEYVEHARAKSVASAFAPRRAAEKLKFPVPGRDVEHACPFGYPHEACAVVGKRARDLFGEKMIVRGGRRHALAV